MLIDATLGAFSLPAQLGVYCFNARTSSGRHKVFTHESSAALSAISGPISAGSPVAMAMQGRVMGYLSRAARVPIMINNNKTVRVTSAMMDKGASFTQGAKHGLYAELGTEPLSV